MGRDSMVMVLLAAAINTSLANSGQWSASQHEEDWGPFCTASHVSSEGIRVGFHGSPGGYVAAYLELDPESSPAEIGTRWQVDGGKSYHLSGGINDYFGYHEMEVHDAGLLGDIAQGTMLTVEVKNFGSLRVPLTGSAGALDAFHDCLSRDIGADEGQQPKSEL